MKFLCTITAFMTVAIHAQTYHDMELTKFPTNNRIKSVIITIEADTSGEKSIFLQNIYKDKNGISTEEITFNKDKDTVTYFTFHFIDSNHSVSTYTSANQHIDHYIEYDQNNMMIKEQYDYLEDHLDHTMEYRYNKNGDLIKVNNNNSWGNEWDTLIYERGLLKLVLHYNESTIIPDSTVYKYDQNNLMTRYYQTRYTKVRSSCDFKYNKQGLLIEMDEQTDIGKKYTRIVKYAYIYDSSNKKKTSTYTFHQGDELLLSGEINYDKNGELISKHEIHHKTKGGIKKTYLINYY